MKAVKHDYLTFERCLEQYARFGNGQTKQQADVAEGILEMLQDAKLGYLGRTCACGAKAVATAVVQPAPSWPLEAHCFCRKHLDLVNEYEQLMDLIRSEGKDVLDK